MDDIIYVQAVPRIRAVENTLLDKGKIQRMIDSNSSSDVLKVLQESSYELSMKNVKSLEDYEFMLDEELKKLYSFMYDISPQKNLIDIMAVKYDYHNIKVLLKSKFLQKEFKEILIPIGIININELTKCILEEEYKNIPKIMEEAIKSSIEAFKENEDPQKIDIIIDRYMYMDMLYKANKVNNSYLLKFLKANIDLINIKTLIRVKKQDKSRKFLEYVLIEDGNIKKEQIVDMYNLNYENIVNKLQYTEYGQIIKLSIEEYTKNKNLRVLEKLSDNFIMDFIKDAKYISFGPEPLIAYMLAKENEIKIIRIIIVGKINKISPQVIRERLREIYV